jgi:hypothetical protein
MTSATASLTPDSREVSLPVEASPRWLREPTNDFGRLAITSPSNRGPIVREYDVQINRDACGNPVGYVLADDDDWVYQLPADLSACDGEGCLARGGECEHQKSLMAALALSPSGGRR